MENDVVSMSMKELYKVYPYSEDFFKSIGIVEIKDSKTILENIEGLNEDFFEDCGMNGQQIIDNFYSFMDKMRLIKTEDVMKIQSITVVGGWNKFRVEENVNLTLKPGEIISIVGPTGSGKSRLLGDIECMAQGDTPTGRKILINGIAPKENDRFSMENKLVAQLSQNMNFVMDLTVTEFITMHAESRMIEDIDSVVRNVMGCANELAGEKFYEDTPVTQLSGGQSRALMIADTALLSLSPIVLIDEIENAGVDRKKALELLVNKEKIVLMSTHDPILALMGNRRVVIKNGGILSIIERNDKQLENMEYLEKIDVKLQELRNLIRNGNPIEFDVKNYFEVG